MRTFAKTPVVHRPFIPPKAAAKTPDEPSPAAGSGHFSFDLSRVPTRSKSLAKSAGEPDMDKELDLSSPSTVAGPAFSLDDFFNNPAVSPVPDPLQAGPGAGAAPQPVQAPPAAPAPAAVKHVAPNFILDKKTDPRSNTLPSTQTKSPPTFVGKAVKNGATWNYELTSVESKGKIRIVYYTDDHYPAPTPTDDSGTLSNVTQANWKIIAKDLEDNKEGVPAFWSAYQREDLHEDYHWVVEWQGEMKKELVKAETDIAALAVGIASAPTSADAEKVLAPQAKTVFDTAMGRATAAYNALPDTPGSAPYKAQAPALTALKARVDAHAATQKW